MNAYSILRVFLLSSSLLSLGACGTTILGGGTGGEGTGSSGTSGTGASGTGTSGTGASGTSGTGASGTGGTCTNSPGNHTISTAGYSLACTQDSDCMAVYAGDVCHACDCPNTVIAISGLAMYQQQEAAALMGCCPPASDPCPCPLIAVPVCQQGTCVAGTVAQVCGGVPSPVSCTPNSCPSGYTCTPDPVPTTCHPSQCFCAAGSWACSKDCMMNGSTCYIGI
jgi:hypothetical protein